MLQRHTTEGQTDLENTVRGTAPAQSANRARSSSPVDVFNPKPSTSASHLPPPNVIPVSLHGNLHRVPQIRSTVEQEARVTCGYVRDPQRPGATPSVSNGSTPTGSSNLDERVPLLPSRRNPPTARPGIKTEFIPFAMTLKAAYLWVWRSKAPCDSKVCHRAHAIRNRTRFHVLKCIGDAFF